MRPTTRIVGATILLASGCGGPDDPARLPVTTAKGALTWEVTFEGGDSCTYTRHYDAVEDRSAPWLCRACDTIWRAEVTLEGADCHERVSGGPAAPVEWIGRDDDGFYRTTYLHTRLFPSGEVSEDAGVLSVAHVAEAETDEGVVELRISGDLTLGVVLADPMHGWRPPERYACGWPKEDPEPYVGDWTLAVGKVVPDGWFRDRCDEVVRLHDLAGRYLVVDVAASDCPPCQAMAQGERGFVDAMAEEGVEVEVVTLLVPSLAAVLDPAPQALLQAWSEEFLLHTPVLGDRGWGVFVAGDSVPQFGYPTTVVVGPDLRVLDVSVGFGSWEYYRDVIDAHAR